MGTFFIIVLCLVVITALIIGAAEDTNDLSGLFIFSIIIVFIFGAVVVSKINRETIDQTSKRKVIPQIKVETIQEGNRVISSDTTYIYTFIND